MAWYMYAQIPMTGPMDVEVRVHGDPLAILPSARKALQEMNPNLPLIRPMTQRAQYDTTISGQVLFARLAGFFGFLAVVLVAAGLYGTLAYRVSMRTAEIGVRMAVGARRGQVVWMILRDSLVLTVTGVAIGIPFALLPLVRLTRNRALMGVDANHRVTTTIGWVIGVLISLLNVVLIYLTLSARG